MVQYGKLFYESIFYNSAKKVSILVVTVSCSISLFSQYIQCRIEFVMVILRFWSGDFHLWQALVMFIGLNISHTYVDTSNH